MYGGAYRLATEAGQRWAGPEQPELLPGLASWYEDFFELSTDRQFGMAAGPIPRSSIVEHTRGWPQDDADMFRACIRRMDSVYLNHKPGKKPTMQMDPDMTPQERLKRIFGDRIN